MGDGLAMGKPQDGRKEDRRRRAGADGRRFWAAAPPASTGGLYGPFQMLCQVSGLSSPWLNIIYLIGTTAAALPHG